MPKFFNTAGPCRPEDHYMVAPESRLPGVRQLIDQKLYFVLHAPRRAGKTTALRTLAEDLTAEGKYAALITSCEVGQKLTPDLEGSIAGLLSTLERQARLYLPEELRPAPVDPQQPPESRLIDFLTRWSERSPSPVVLFLDEIDALFDDALISVLRQLRSGYDARPGGFPQAIALIGLRDVRDYRLHARGPQPSLGTASPFNIKARSLTLSNFSPDDISQLCAQHSSETGQAWTPEALDQIHSLTRGQPWLVNALAQQITWTEVTDPTIAIQSIHVDAAREAVVRRRDTHLDSLIDRLREPRVERVLAPILAGELLVGDRLDDDIAYVEDLGLVERSQGHLEIANPIYHEVIPRALASIAQATIYHETSWYLTEDGRIDLPTLLKGFLDFWRQHGEAMMSNQAYREVAFQLVVMSFLQRITNGGGRIDREYAIGRGRIDLCIHWPYPGGHQTEALELKVWRDGRPDPEVQGLKQLSSYLHGLGLDHGALLIFDQRSSAESMTERSTLEEREFEDQKVWLVRL